MLSVWIPIEVAAERKIETIFKSGTYSARGSIVVDNHPLNPCALVTSSIGDRYWFLSSFLK